MTQLTEAAAYWAIVPAAGIGSRMHSVIPKQYLTLHGKPIIQYALETLLANSHIQKVVVAIHPQDDHWRTLTIASHPKILLTVGGVDRATSVLNSLKALKPLAKNHDWVLVHDAARPCLTNADTKKLIEQLATEPVGGILGYPVRDTMKQVDNRKQISQTLERERLWHALTPQMFRYQMLFDALEKALLRSAAITDEAAAMELSGFKPIIIEGRADNIKLTNPEDLKLIAFFLTEQQ